MRARLGRECLYVPSCRLGRYVALRHWCEPGGKILMVPGQRRRHPLRRPRRRSAPRPGPAVRSRRFDRRGAVPDSVWNGLRAVLTTNLYGNPDPARRLRERCDRLGMPLIEDAAHAIGSVTDGDPVGSFGDAAVFSLSKHVGAKAGGFRPGPARPAGAGPGHAARPGPPHRRTRLRRTPVRRVGRTRAAAGPGGPVDPAPPRPPGTGGDPDAAAPRGTGARPGRHALAGHGSTAWRSGRRGRSCGTGRTSTPSGSAAPPGHARRGRTAPHRPRGRACAPWPGSS